MLFPNLILYATMASCAIAVLGPATTQLDALISAYNLPALAVSANTNNHPTTGLTQAYAGVRKVHTLTPVTANDTWHLGSNTKAMTATAAALLIQDGLLRWNSTLAEIFGAATPPYNNFAMLIMAPELANVTVAELAAHRSGLTGTFGIDGPPLLHAQMLQLYELNATAGRAVAAGAVLALPAGGTRGVYEYANNNYVVLGLVIDAVAREAAEDVIRTRIWEKLGMASAAWGASARHGVGGVEGEPWPHLVNVTSGETVAYRDAWPAEFRDYAPYMNTAGRARMTLADYDKWLRLHVDETAQRAVGLGAEQLGVLHTAFRGDGDGENVPAYTCGGWIQAKTGCDGVKNGGGCLIHEGSNVMNVAFGWVDTGLNATYAAATNGPLEGGGGIGVETAIALMLNGTLTP